MRIFKSALLFLLILTTLIVAKPRIGVLSFTLPNDNFPNAGSSVADIINKMLLDDGRYTVIERTQLETVLREQALGQSGTVDSAQAAKVGELSGCEYIITGNISEIRQTKGMEKSARTFCVVAGCILGGLPGIIFGAVVPVKEYVTSLTLKIIDVNTGEIKYMGSGEGKDNKFLNSLQESAKRSIKNFLK